MQGDEGYISFRAELLAVRDLGPIESLTHTHGQYWSTTETHLRFGITSNGVIVRWCPACLFVYSMTLEDVCPHCGKVLGGNYHTNGHYVSIEGVYRTKCPVQDPSDTYDGNGR